MIWDNILDRCCPRKETRTPHYVEQGAHSVCSCGGGTSVLGRYIFFRVSFSTVVNWRCRESNHIFFDMRVGFDRPLGCWCVNILGLDAVHVVLVF